MGNGFSRSERNVLYGLGAAIVIGSSVGTCVLREAYHDLEQETPPPIREPALQLQVAQLRHDLLEARTHLMQLPKISSSYLLATTLSELRTVDEKQRKLALIRVIGSRNDIAVLLDTDADFLTAPSSRVTQNTR